MRSTATWPARSRPARARLVGAFVVTVCLGTLTGALPAEATITTYFVASQTRTLAPGISHAKGTMRTSDGIQAVQVATIDPADPRVRVRALLSNDRVVNTERPSRLADRKSQPGSLAMVATNGDVSVRGAKDGYAAPHSLHIQNGEVMVATACTRPTLGIDPQGGARIDDVRVKVYVEGGASMLRVHHVNTPPVAGQLVLFTPRFGPSTLTDANRTEVLLTVDGNLPPHGTLAVVVADVRPGAGNTPLGNGQMVLSARGPVGQQLSALHVGKHLTLSSTVLRYSGKRCGPDGTEAPGWFGVTEALGGNYFVARHGLNAAPGPGEDNNGAQPHPRTSVGVTADGRVLMVVNDGRQRGYSVGVTMAEMGDLMLHLGAVDAINLDGGGSTVMAIRKPGAAHITVSDRPSDGHERSLTQALTVFSVDAPGS
jgi:uncharacterized protein YigE (DUF2233 family)